MKAEGLTGQEAREQHQWCAADPALAQGCTGPWTLVSGYFTGTQPLFHTEFCSCQLLLKFLHTWGQVYLNDLTSYHLDFVPFEKHGPPLSSLIFKTRRGTQGSQYGDLALVHPCQSHLPGTWDSGTTPANATK